MPNTTNRRNQPPTGEGKNQPRRTGPGRKLAGRSEVAQAQRHHPELNIADEQQPAGRGDTPRSQPRRKAGR